MKTTKYDFLVKQFKKIWEEKKKKEEFGNLMVEKLMKSLPLTDIPEEEWIVYIIDTAIMGIIPKKKEIKELIDYNFDTIEHNIGKIKEILKEKQEGEILAKFSTELLKKGMDLMKIYDEVKIKLNKDSPIWIECGDFVFLLAPRQEPIT